MAVTRSRRWLRNVGPLDSLRKPRVLSAQLSHANEVESEALQDIDFAFALDLDIPGLHGLQGAVPPPGVLSVTCRPNHPPLQGTNQGSPAACADGRTVSRTAITITTSQSVMSDGACDIPLQGHHMRCGTAARASTGNTSLYTAACAAYRAMINVPAAAKKMFTTGSVRRSPTLRGSLTATKPPLSCPAATCTHNNNKEIPSWHVESEKIGQQDTRRRRHRLINWIQTFAGMTESVSLGRVYQDSRGTTQSSGSMQKPAASEYHQRDFAGTVRVAGIQCKNQCRSLSCAGQPRRGDGNA
ncbi:hypothetical protein NUW54_g12339 [Trametes sanguinea]|uniref:Uncharacterized protein n=1 Tax=Trametes sanguinea TaxID=158606 RepID=A0ACC1N0W5_9APHY|nr:hypothetical protein NUW54_g12339 [Trametes sanguinea]